MTPAQHTDASPAGLSFWAIDSVESVEFLVDIQKPPTTLMCATW